VRPDSFYEWKDSDSEERRKPNGKFRARILAASLQGQSSEARDERAFNEAIEEASC